MLSIRHAMISKRIRHGFRSYLTLLGVRCHNFRDKLFFCNTFIGKESGYLGQAVMFSEVSSHVFGGTLS